jgi:hypothetical protein
MAAFGRFLSIVPEAWPVALDPKPTCVLRNDQRRNPNLARGLSAL